MLSILLSENKNLIVTIKNWTCLFDISNKDPIYEYENNVEITNCDYLSKNNIIIYADLNKKLSIYDLKTKSLLGAKTLSKRASHLAHTKEEDYLLIGDKTGDVYMFKLDLNNLEQAEIKLLMGSLSMLTDMKFNLNEKLLITSDRDEKIRISCFPNAYNINSYLLGHKEFVSQIELISEKRLLSSSGDCNLILWNIENAKVVQKVDTLKYVGSDKLKGIVRFDFNSSTNKILVQLFNAEFLLNFNYNPGAENEIRFESKIDLNEKFHKLIGFNNDFYMFAQLNPNENNVFNIRKLDHQTNKFNQIDSAENESLTSIAKYLTEKIKTKNVIEIRNELETDYLNYFKVIINNLDEYYERKSKRIMEKQAKRQRTDSNSNNANDDDEDSN